MNSTEVQFKDALEALPFFQMLVLTRKREVASYVEVSIEGRGREVPATTNADTEHVEEVRVGRA
jgi:hypothetical protein